jgi:hypothetical protein
MRTLRTALLLCGTWLCASACRTNPYAGKPDPRFDADFAAVERALIDGDDATARARIDGVLAQKPNGPTLARAKGLEGAVIEREIGRYGPQFDAVKAALDDRDLATAERILERMLVTQPSGAALERARAFQRVIVGRQLVGALSLALEAAPTGDPGTYDLVLHASHTLDTPLALHCAGTSLSFLALGIDPYGIEQRAARNALIDALDDLRLAPGAPVELHLGTFQLEVRGLIASRGCWELNPMAGSIERGGEAFPAMNVAVAPLEVVRLAAGLPGETVTPEELVSYVDDPAHRQGPRTTPGLLSRAVRVENSRRIEALDALAPVALRMGNPDLACVVPALRWLSGERELGADPRAWRIWLETRVAAQGEPQNRRAPAAFAVSDGAVPVHR